MTLGISLTDGQGNQLSNAGLVLKGQFSATGQSTSLSLRGDFNLSLWGTFVGQVQLERSFDGITWLPLTYSDGTVKTYTAPVTLTLSEPEAAVQYRLNCTSYTSGTINYRVSQ